jgi:7-cyano-7-deazaguanine reductase
MNYDYSTVDPMLLETFSNPFRVGMNGAIHIEAPEFTSLCPKTGLPDYGNIVIDYIPDLLCLESKSYKLYLLSFRQHGEFHEACVARIHADLTAILQPKWLRVEGRFNPRGGITFWPTVETTDQPAQLEEDPEFKRAMDKLVPL